MVQQVRPHQSVLKTFEQYLIDRQEDFSFEGDIVDVWCFLGPFGYEQVRFREIGSLISVYARLTERIPLGFDDCMLRLAYATEDRLACTELGELVWSVSLPGKKFSTEEDFDNLFVWLEREAYIAETVVDVYASTKVELNVYAMLGFGEVSELDRAN